MSKRSEKKINRRRKSRASKTKTQHTLHRLAVIDHLTGLYNRRHFDKLLKKTISESKSKGKQFSILMIDIDNFKKINDTYGHVVGDNVLIALAKVFKNSVRRGDNCFRYGGDEIAVILPDAERKSAEIILQRLKNAVEKHKFSIDDEESLFLELSIGLAVYPDDGSKPQVLIKKADELLYSSKHRKRRSAEPFLLQTKLVPPIIRENIIHRPRLVSLLKENINKKLITVVADAGYGKTTLLAQFINELTISYIWYQIDKTDQEIDIFMRYLIEGVGQYFPEFGKRTVSVLNHTRGSEIELEVLIGTFINELVEVTEQKIMFFFDDLQEIYESKKAVQGLEYLLNHLPPNVSIVIAARSNLPFSLERLHLKNETIVFDQQDLKFNKGEIRELCKKLADYVPKPKEIKELQGDSEGWITCLQFLIPLSKQKSIFAKSKKSLLARLYEYFDKEVYSPLDKNLKHFLTATSVFEYLIPEACDFLLSRNESQQILEDLQRRHLFISAYEAPEPSYRYHHLFKDFLSQKLKKTGFYKKFHNKAGKYWEKKDVVLTALQHYSEAQNFKLVARLIEKFGDDYIDTGKVEFVQQYIENLPEIIINTSPTLIRLKGRISFWNCDWDKAKFYYLWAKRLARRQKNYREALKSIYHQLIMKVHLGEHRGMMRLANIALRSKALKSLRTKVQFLNAFACALFFNGRVKDAISVYEEILKSAKKISDNRHIETALLNLTVLHDEVGKFADAQNYLDMLTARLNNRSPSYGLISTFDILGNVLMIRGELNKAQELLEKGRKYANLFNDRKLLCTSDFLLGLLHVYAGKLDQAEELLNKAEELSLEIGYTHILSGICYAKAELLVCQGDFYCAKQYINKALRLPIPPQTRALHLITKAKVDLSLKNLDIAAKALDQALPNLKELKHGLLGCYVQMSRLYLLKKNGVKAKSAINKAISLAEKNSYDFLLTYKLMHYPEIVKFIIKVGLKSPYVQHIMLKLPYSEATAIFTEPDMKAYDFVIRLFGKMQIFKRGKEIKTGVWRTKGLQEIFSFFMVESSNSITLEKIINTFWSDHKPKSAKSLFHVTLHWIRKAVDKDIIIFNKDGYRLSTKYMYWIDAQEFEKLTKDGDRLLKNGNRVGAMIKYEEAIPLYRGDFMDDFYGGWCQQKRRYFQEVYLTILKKLAHGHYEIGNYEKTLKFCNLFIEKDPYYEEMYCLAMRCSAALNDLAGLNNCFSNLKKNLSDGLKTTPSIETKILFETLMKQRRT